MREEINRLGGESSEDGPEPDAACTRPKDQFRPASPTVGWKRPTKSDSAPDAARLRPPAAATLTEGAGSGAASCRSISRAFNLSDGADRIAARWPEARRPMPFRSWETLFTNAGGAGEGHGNRSHATFAAVNELLRRSPTIPSPRKCWKTGADLPA